MRRRLALAATLLVGAFLAGLLTGCSDEADAEAAWAARNAEVAARCAAGEAAVLARTRSDAGQLCIAWAQREQLAELRRIADALEVLAAGRLAEQQRGYLTEFGAGPRPLD